MQTAAQRNARRRARTAYKRAAEKRWHESKRRQDTAAQCHCGRPRGLYDSDHCHACGCEEYEATCNHVWDENEDD